jgi:hypothetical protein
LTDDHAFGADDVAGALYARPKLRKLRFLMTGNMLHDPQRLIRILTDAERPVQLVLAGKAHPQDCIRQAGLYPAGHDQAMERIHSRMPVKA